MNDKRKEEVLRRIEAKAHALGAEITPKDTQTLSTRLAFLWVPNTIDRTDSNAAADVTKWRHGRSRRVYEEIQDMDSHLFLAVVLSVNPTESGQTKFQRVVDHLRNVEDYGIYRFTPKESTRKALIAFAEEHNIANNNRYRRLVEGLFDGHNVNSQVQFAFSQVPMERLQLLPGLVVEAVTSSSKFAQETTQGETKTTCVNVFLRPREEDGSIVITAGSRTLHMIRNALAMSEWHVKKT